MKHFHCSLSLPLRKTEMGSAGFQGFCLCIIFVCFIASCLSLVTTNHLYHKRKAEVFSAQKACIDTLNINASIYSRLKGLNPGDALPLAALQKAEMAGELELPHGRKRFPLPNGSIVLCSAAVPAEGNPYAVVGYLDFKNKKRIWYPSMPQKGWGAFDFFKEIETDTSGFKSVGADSVRGAVR